MMRTTGNDRGAVKVATVTRLVAILGVLGVFGFDGFSVMANHVATENDAQTAAYAASQAWHNSPSLDGAYAAAVTSLAGTGDTVLTQDFSVDPDGTIHLLVEHTAHTVVISHIGPLRHLAVTTEHGDANSVN
jgi:hypothetical protein